jgi:hypothetical protein
MIVSQKHRYVFVELPLTGSSAISAELRANYDGVEVLHKHSRYHEFLAHCTPEQRKYFVFSGIRNPLDTMVSKYVKFREDHRGDMTNPALLAENGGWVSKEQVERFEFIRQEKADFPAYFRRFHRHPYDNWSRLHHRQFDHIIRFENVTQGFEAALKAIGLSAVRALPVKNKTDKKADFLSYYTPEIYAHAAAILGPFMRDWGYELPREWNVSVPLSASLKYAVSAPIRRLMMRLANPPLGRKSVLPRDLPAA